MKSVPNISKRNIRHVVSLLAAIGCVVYGYVQQTNMKSAVVPGKLFPTPAPLTSQSASFYPIIRVVDGDTFHVSVEGKDETVRMIGIDTPETQDPRKPVQCYGKEASEETKRLLTGKSVRLENDPTQGDKDKYNRLLRFVFLSDGTDVNEYLVRQGYAFEYTYESNPYRYQTQFLQAQKEAREQKRGLWADNTCAGVR
jgi:micrococcal nuclease